MADNVEKAKEFTASFGDKDKFYSFLADDIYWKSAMGAESQGKEAVVAMMDGMRAKMGDNKPNLSNWVAKDASTVTYANEMKMGDQVIKSTGEMKFNDAGKICSMISTKV